MLSLLKRVLGKGIYETKAYNLFLFVFRNKAYQTKLNEHNFYRSITKELPTGLAFDIGANNGGKTSHFSKIFKKTIACEPSKNLCVFLNNRFKKITGVQIVNKAVSNQNGSSVFYEFSDGNAYNTLSPKWVTVLISPNKFRGNIPDELPPSEVQTETVTLDKLTDSFGFPDFIKIDVEGHELSVIEGMSFAPALISIECNLPIFKDETISCINRLILLSPTYRFNFSISEPPESFVLEEWCNKDKLLSILNADKYKFMELFAKQ